MLMPGLRTDESSEGLVDLLAHALGLVIEGGQIFERRVKAGVPEPSLYDSCGASRLVMQRGEGLPKPMQFETRANREL